MAHRTNIWIAVGIVAVMAVVGLMLLMGDRNDTTSAFLGRRTSTTPISSPNPADGRCSCGCATRISPSPNIGATLLCETFNEDYSSCDRDYDPSQYETVADKESDAEYCAQFDGKSCHGYYRDEDAQHAGVFRLCNPDPA